MSLREDYDLPRRGVPLFPVWMWIVMIGGPVSMLVLWLIFPNTWITVVLLAIAVVVGVGLAIGGLLQARSLEHKPGRHPVRPPSTEGP